jgi:hypothetical protein
VKTSYIAETPDRRVLGWFWTQRTAKDAVIAFGEGWHKYYLVREQGKWRYNHADYHRLRAAAERLRQRADTKEAL